MYHICKLTCGTRVIPTITDQLLTVLELIQPWGMKVESVYQSHEWESIYNVIRESYCNSIKEHPNTSYTLLINGRVCTDYEIMYALEDMAPRVLGWRVRRFGDRLGVLGRFLRRRRRARRARRRERRVLRSARREKRRVARKNRRAEFWKRFRNLPIIRILMGDQN